MWKLTSCHLHAHLRATGRTPACHTAPQRGLPRGEEVHTCRGSSWLSRSTRETTKIAPRQSASQDQQGRTVAGQLVVWTRSSPVPAKKCLGLHACVFVLFRPPNSVRESVCLENKSNAHRHDPGEVPDRLKTIGIACQWVPATD